MIAASAGAQEAAWQGFGGEWRDLSGAWQPVEGEASGLTWTETEAGVQAALPADVLFDFDSATLKPQAEAALRQLAQGIRERDPKRVRIEGHTDAKGREAYNQDLSERRAEAVLRHLVDGEGIEAKLMQARGLGESRPVAPNTKPDGSDDPEGRQRNRRVEVVLEG